VIEGVHKVVKILRPLQCAAEPDQCNPREVQHVDAGESDHRVAVLDDAQEEYGVLAQIADESEDDDWSDENTHVIVAVSVIKQEDSNDRIDACHQQGRTEDAHDPRVKLAVLLSPPLHVDKECEAACLDRHDLPSLELGQRPLGEVIVAVIAVSIVPAWVIGLQQRWVLLRRSVDLDAPARLDKLAQ
jgi:hypothetical protein